MNWIIPIIMLLIGAVGGFFIGVYYLRRQMEKMQNDPEMLKKMAKQMGYNMNNQQLQKAQTMMKNNRPAPGQTDKSAHYGDGRERRRCWRDERLRQFSRFG